jgi:adenylate cyclase
LVPHPHEVAVVAVDMRGFSTLVRVLDDTQYVTGLIGEYLTALTEEIERHRGIVFQYTGDGLLALFLPELAGTANAEMFDQVVRAVGPALHERFDALYGRWRSQWCARGTPGSEVGLGVGVSFGRATIGFIGPAGKKQFGVLGEPVNVAAFLCSAAEAGTVLIERESFRRAGTEPADAPIVRLESKKPHQRIEAACLRYEPAEAVNAARSSS